mgnify:CR=1 FL=1
MNWKKIIAIGLTGCFLFSGCAEQRQNAQKMGEEGTQEDSYESTTFAMDTVMTFHIVAPDGEDLLIDAEQEVKRLEKLFSVTDEGRPGGAHERLRGLHRRRQRPAEGRQAARQGNEQCL